MPTVTDTDLDKYQDSQDVFTSDLSVATVGDEVAIALSHHTSFTIDRPATDVWQSLRDLNSWMEDLHYSVLVGDAAQGSTLVLSIDPGHQDYYMEHYGFGSEFKKEMIVREIAPERILLLEELSPDTRHLAAYYLLALSEHDGRTAVTSVMSYAPLWVPKDSEEQTRAGYQAAVDEVTERWLTRYIPRLRQRVESS